MLRQLSHRGRVDAMLKDGLTSGDALSNGLAQILQVLGGNAGHRWASLETSDVASLGASLAAGGGW